MLHLVLEDKHLIGQAKRFGVHSTQHEHFVVIFEDDGETGYFYAMDLTSQDQPIVDSLYIYAVDSIENKHEPRQFQICWSENGMQAFLLVNGYPHASFDYTNLIGYNNSKLPMPDLSSMWTHQEINDKLVAEWLKV